MGTVGHISLCISGLHYHVSIWYRFWDIRRRIMACRWNMINDHSRSLKTAQLDNVYITSCQSTTLSTAPFTQISGGRGFRVSSSSGIRPRKPSRSNNNESALIDHVTQREPCRQLVSSDGDRQSQSVLPDGPQRGNQKRERRSPFRQLETPLHKGKTIVCGWKAQRRHESAYFPLIALTGYRSHAVIL